MGGSDSGWGDDRGLGGDQLRPLNLGDVLDGSFRLSLAQWRAFAVAGGLMVVGVMVLTATLVGVVAAAIPSIAPFTDPTTAGNAALTANFTAGALIGAWLLFMVVFVLFGALVYGTGVHIAAIGYRAGQVSPMASLRAVGRRLLGLVGTMFLTGLAVAVTALVPIALFGAIGYATESGGLVGLGVFIALVVAVIASIRLAVAVPALLVEGVGPATAVRRSNQLVKGRTGMTFLTLLVVSIIVFIISLVLQIPFSIVAGLFDNAFGAILALVGQFVNIVISLALSSAAIVLIYFDRRVRKEGYDLTELAGELGGRRDELG